jgi:hypothetical protein
MKKQEVTKIEIFFSKLFPLIILKNEIVGTIVNVIMRQLKEYDQKIKNKLNTDI